MPDVVSKAEMGVCFMVIYKDSLCVSRMIRLHRARIGKGFPQLAPVYYFPFNAFFAAFFTAFFTAFFLTELSCSKIW